MYSPGTGRFFGVDPLAEDFATWSPYVYTFNNPVNWRDPDGRSADDPKAMARAMALGLGNVVGIATGFAVATGATLATVPTGGVTAPVALGGMAIVAANSTGLALSISNFIIAYNTPDGMTAESFGNLTSVVAKGLGMSATSQEVIGIAQDIALGGGLIRVGKLIVDDRIVEAAIQVEGLMYSSKKILESYIEERRNQEETQNQINNN